MKPERNDIRAGGEGDVLLPVHRVSNGLARDLLARIEVPQRFAGARVERGEEALIVPGEDQPAGSGEES